METCDQCGPAVQAKERALLPSGRSLTYCSHCASANMAGLIKAHAHYSHPGGSAMTITARLVARREAAAAEWRRAAKINVQWGQRARRHLRLWDTLLDLWTLRGRR